MNQDDLFRVDIDFKVLSDMVWTIASKVEKDPKYLKKLIIASKDNPESSEAWLLRMIKSILDGMWSSSEDLAKQMDLNINDHHKYVELYQYLKNKK